MEAFHVPHVHRASINRQRGSVQNDRTFDSTKGNWVVMHKEQQQGVSTPFSTPGRLSEHEPLVHAIDNWVLDYVLGVKKKARTFEGFSLQDLDVLPENVVA